MGANSRTLIDHGSVKGWITHALQSLPPLHRNLEVILEVLVGVVLLAGLSEIPKRMKGRMIASTVGGRAR